MVRAPSMRVSLVLRVMAALRDRSRAFARGAAGLIADFIDVAEHSYRAFGFKQRYNAFAARRFGSNHSDERHIRRSRAARVVHRVAEVKQLLARMFGGDLQQAFGMRLGVAHVIRGDDHAEAIVTALALQRNSDFNLIASGEDRQVETVTELIEEAVLRQPALAMDHAFAEKQVVEMIDDLPILHLYAEIGADLLRQRPVVIPAAGIFVILNLLTRDSAAGEVLHRSYDRLAVRFGNVH